MNKNITISLLSLLVLSCLCVSGILLAGGITIFSSNRAGTSSPADLPSPVDSIPLVRATLTPRPTRTPTPLVSPTSLPSPTPRSLLPGQVPTLIPPLNDPIPEDIAAQMDKIEKQVNELRLLEPQTGVNRILMSPAALKSRVETDFLQDNDPRYLVDHGRVLTALGLIEPGYDLYDLYLNLYTEQVAGFYDSETGEMVVIQGQSFSGLERSTYAHEYTHALQDQNFNLRGKLNLNEDYCHDHSEYCAAVTALIEGDASLTEQGWLYYHSTDQDMEDIEKFYSNYSSPVLDSAPPFLQEDFGFPYVQGSDFVVSLFDEGGFEQVNLAYTNPPTTTEQILHPEKYLVDEPLEVRLPEVQDLLENEVRELDSGVMGEWYTYLILARGSRPAIQLSPAQAGQAAAGWGGDGYAVYWDEDAGQPIVLLHTRWDSPTDAVDFFEAFGDYGTLRWNQPIQQNDAEILWQSIKGESILRLSGGETLWVLAPDSATARLLADEILPLP